MMHTDHVIRMSPYELNSYGLCDPQVFIFKFFNKLIFFNSKYFLIYKKIYRLNNS